MRTTRRDPPDDADLRAIRPAVAEWRRRRLRHEDIGTAQEAALEVYRKLRPREDAHDARSKVMNAIRWAEQEFPEWMAGR